MSGLGPVEEVGWCGFALRILQRWLVPFWAGLLTERQAAVGAGLHAVLCGLSGLQRHPEALCNDARGSIVLAMLFHFQMNNPLWPDAPPYDMFVYVAAAVIVAWLNRRPLFSKAGAVTDVIPHRTTVGSR